MEIQIKKTVKAGNSSAVILPRSWLNKEVRIELIKKTPEIMLIECIDILSNYIKISEIIGIYLVGSYAREEQDENSDIDILVITKDSDKEMIHEGIYNILIVSKELLNYKLTEDLFPIGQMLKEAKALLNKDFIQSINVNVTKKNISWYINTTEDKLELVNKIIEKNKSVIDKRVAYTLILRLRTLYIIDKLIKKENYSKTDFIRLINNVSKGKSAYNAYLAVKNNLNKNENVNYNEINRLYEYLKKLLNEVKCTLNKL